jgi:tRNA-splicing ligase RtcB
MELIKKEKFVYSIKQEGEMKVAPRIYANDEITSVLRSEEINPNNSLKQLQNISSLPGILGAVCLADMHLGYGAPIGTSTASDLKEGVITFAATGYDINCGIHSLIVPLPAKEIIAKNKLLADTLFKEIPAGVGIGGKLKLNKTEMDEVLEKGAEYIVQRGYGNKKDLGLMEENGRIKGADAKSVSDKAKERASDQVGTLGSGNHYCEVQEIEKIFDEKGAKAFGLEKGNTFVSIHCGSRAIGHQIGSDYLQVLDTAAKKYGINLPQRDLACAPIQSEEGQKYFSAIKSASNAAFANRELIGVLVKRAFEKVFQINENEIKTFYDIGHNTAKIESHKINSKKQKVLVQRKGSTRGFGPGQKEVPLKYRKIGQPVIVGGSMGTSSFILKGTKKAMDETFGSTIHGAGRSMSRTKALMNYSGQALLSELEKNGVLVKARSIKGLPEEAPNAYKDIEMVVNVMDKSGISGKVARLKPLICIKG